MANYSRPLYESLHDPEWDIKGLELHNIHCLLFYFSYLSYFYVLITVQTKQRQQVKFFRKRGLFDSLSTSAEEIAMQPLVKSRGGV